MNPAERFLQILREEKTKSTAEKCIRLLRTGADMIEENPYCLDTVMIEIEEFWGHETGRLGD